MKNNQDMETNNRIPDENGIYHLRVEPYATRFYSDDTSYGIVCCKDMDTGKEEKGAIGEYEYIYDQITIVGNMPKLTIGKTYECTAELITHPTYGEQFKVLSIFSREGNTRDDELSMLEALVSPMQYRNIVSVYDMPITAILNDKFDYNKVRGIGEVLYKKLKDRVIANQQYTKAVSELGRFGITFKVIRKVVDQYGSCELAVEKVMSDPYILYRDIRGIGFNKADTIARTIGMSNNSPQRILAGIVYVLEQEEIKGNTWASVSSVRDNTEELLKVYIDDFDRYLDNEIFYLDADNGILAMRKVYECEKTIASELFRILKHNTGKVLFNDSEVNQNIDDIQKELNITYATEQRQLFFEVCKNNVLVFTGKAGSGKSFSMNGVLKMLSKRCFNIELASPTAKAAKVLSNSTGREAKTIHRLLKWQPSGFAFNQRNQLRCDVLVIDEASMIDIYLFRSLLQAVPSGCKIILVGDPGQLESVAVGNVLHDMINSGVIPLVSLKTIYRQALDSGIIYISAQVDSGKKFYENNQNIYEFGVKKDCKVWFDYKDNIALNVVSLYSKCLNKWTPEDILVISPIKKSKSGVVNLNKLIQEVANPADEDKAEIAANNYIFREGDKVRHTKNDYEAEWLDENYEVIDGNTGVFNGDFGIIKEISDKCLFVDFGDKIIKYRINSLGNVENLDLAYVITTHSSQGSQSPVVIGAMDTSHYMNLKRNLLYTMITRASECFLLAAEKKAVGIAIYNNTIPKKQTFLEDMLKNY